MANVKKAVQLLRQVIEALEDDGDADIDRAPAKKEPEDARSAQRTRMGLAPLAGAPKPFRVTAGRFEFSQHALAMRKIHGVRA